MQAMLPESFPFYPFNTECPLKMYIIISRANKWTQLIFFHFISAGNLQRKQEMCEKRKQKLIF